MNLYIAGESDSSLKISRLIIAYCNAQLDYRLRQRIIYLYLNGENAQSITERMNACLSRLSVQSEPFTIDQVRDEINAFIDTRQYRPSLERYAEEMGRVGCPD